MESSSYESQDTKYGTESKHIKQDLQELRILLVHLAFVDVVLCCISFPFIGVLSFELTPFPQHLCCSSIVRTLFVDFESSMTSFKVINPVPISPCLTDCIILPESRTIG